MDERKQIHINLPVRPAAKVNAETMAKVKSSTFFSRLNKSMESNERINSDLLTFMGKLSVVRNYYDKVFQNPYISDSQQVCIDFLNLIFFNVYFSGITHFGFMDNTPIYLDCVTNKIIVGLEDIDQIMTSRPVITDQELANALQIPANEFKDAKYQLIGNSFKNTILHIFGKLLSSGSDIDIRDLMKIALCPNGKIPNPIVTRRLLENCPLQFEPGTTANDVKSNLRRTNDVHSIPQTYIDAAETTYKQLEPLIFNKNLEDMIAACFPQISSKDIAHIKQDILNSIPHFLSTISNPSSDETITYVRNVVSFLYSHNLTVFELYPPSKEELFAIFYCSRKLYPVDPPSTSATPYQSNSNIIFIRQVIVEKILSLHPDALELISPNRPDNKITNEFLKYRTELCQKLAIINFHRPNIPQLKGLIHATTSSSDPFSKLATSLVSLTGTDITSLEKLMLLISRIYLGKNLYEEIAGEAFPSFAIINADGPSYFKKFLETILFCQTSSYSIRRLANEDNIPKFIHDKLNGILANIDVSGITITDTSQFQKLAKGTLVSINDQNIGKISHRSTSYYIYIANNMTAAEKQFKSLDDHLTIELKGNTKLAIYEGLDLYESTLFVIASVFWFIDKYLNEQKSSSNTVAKRETITLTSEQKIEKFLSEFCVDTTTKIPREELEKIAIDGLVGSNYEKERTQVAKTIGITNLDFTYSKDFICAFNEWYKTTYSGSSSIDVIKYLSHKYSALFYLKNESGYYQYGPDKGKKAKARGFYGIKINEDKLQQYIEHASAAQETKDFALIEKEFITYLEEILNNALTNLLDTNRLQG